MFESNQFRSEYQRSIIMARTAGEKNNTKKSVKSVNRKTFVKCNYKFGNGKICNKKYSKVSNLNTHVRKDHEFIRWVCPIAGCAERQVSKDAHIRHCESKHGVDVRAVADGHQFSFKDQMQLTDAAKDARIHSLVKILEERNRMINAYYEELVKTKNLLVKYQTAFPSFAPDEEPVENPPEVFEADTSETNENEPSNENGEQVDDDEESDSIIDEECKESDSSYEADEENESDEEMSLSETEEAGEIDNKCEYNGESSSKMVVTVRNIGPIKYIKVGNPHNSDPTDPNEMNEVIANENEMAEVKTEGNLFFECEQDEPLDLSTSGSERN